ncbi:alpha/beta hydrolase-fold protein [Roseiconus lacunae]|uniref:alpha/beta hydrolase-fold protein n=1 Tax=Roseiconus lacunae TaxID=2605694 RepID=UPI001E38532E|nr:alpha/beta hydrolase-fold protein [Roseiconus lacunae]MCD0458242.1 SMP-30/gluconolactonase/LRE family protein [Roseiconus lacunae]
MRSLFQIAAILVIAVPAIASNETDRQVNPDVPRGTVTTGVFDRSEIYPGTTRNFSVYVPAQYDSTKPAHLMVFMDGRNYVRPGGPFRVPTVLDNLIAQEAIPTTIAVFVDPGTLSATKNGAKNRSNRSFEYDAMSDRYAKFLIDEFLPVALKDLNVSSSPLDRAVCGISSGAICAFTVAWHRPDQFGNVLSHIGSYTNIRGGIVYPGLVRKTHQSPKPIKVYLQEGVDDLDNVHGDWPLANHDLAAALQFAGYQYKLEMTEGGHSAKWAGEVLPGAIRWLWDEDAESTKIPSTATKPKWEPHPDAIRQAGVPEGTVEVMSPWESKVFPGMVRDWAIYVPAQYDPKTPAALMVFQDGERMRKIDGRWRIPIVFDNLIARGEMPPTIAVFLNPGHDQSKPRQRNRSSNRGFEYDSLGDRYARFLTEEILPVVEQKYNVSSDPQRRAIGGSSSGAICAFTVAWNRPDQFGKVYSNVGSFTHLRGGNIYPGLVRKTEPKPIRVYMADTSGDVDNAFGSWPWANQRMASALKYMGYDVRFDWAEGYAHNADYGSSRFPDAMAWLWRNETHQPVVDTSDDLGGDYPLLRLLIPGEGWEIVAKDLGFADAPCADAEGNFYYSDMRAPAVYRVDAGDGQQTKIADVPVSGLMFGPDGLLYGCQGSKRQVVAIDPENGTTKTVASDLRPNDLAITKDGTLFVTETPTSRVLRINPGNGEVVIADEGINKPNGIALTADGGTLAVSDYGGDRTWTFRVNADQSLDAKMPTMPMRVPIDPEGEFNFNEPPPRQATAKGDGMAIDRAGRFYVTSELGVQVFDPSGRPCGVLPKPDPSKPLTSCVLAGEGHRYLYVTNGKTIYRRLVNADSNKPVAIP